MSWNFITLISFFRPMRFLMCCFIVATFMRLDAAEDAISFDVDVRDGNIMIYLDGLAVFSGVEVYFSDAGWVKRRSIEIPQSAITRKGERGVLSLVNRDSNGYDINASWGGALIDLVFSFDLQAGGDCEVGVLDFFLMNDLFTDADLGMNGNIEQVIGGGGRVISNRLGDFIVTTSSRVGSWKLRDLRLQAWRHRDFRTFAITDVERHSEGSGHRDSRIEIKYIPSQNAREWIQIYKSRRVLSKIEGRPHLRNQDALVSVIGDIEIAIKNGLARDSLVDLGKRANDIARDFLPRVNDESACGYLVPRPQVIQFDGEERRLKEGRLVVACEGGSDGLQQCARTLIADLGEEMNIDAVLSEAIGDGDVVIRVGGARWNGRKEGYCIEVTQRRVVITGCDERGAFNGTQTFIQMLRKKSDGRVWIPIGRVDDWPDVQFRGMMIECGRGDEASMLAMKRLIKSLARHKFNSIILGESFSGSVRWRSHPEIARPGAMAPEQYLDLANFARGRFMEPIPLVQSLGHCYSIIKSHPELADSQDSRKQGNALSIAHPGTRALLGDIYDECIKLIRPKYFHIGLDEAYPLGAHPMEAGRSASDLFLEHVQWCRQAILASGQVEGVIIWHDLLLSKKEWPGSTANSDAGGTYSAVVHPAIEKMPKDIIIAYWSYYERGEIDAIRYFRNMGFRVLGCPWYDDANAFDLADSIFRNGAMGVLGTSWTYMDFHNQMTLACAENSWSINRPTLKSIDYDSVGRLRRSVSRPAPSRYDNFLSKPIELSVAQGCGFLRDFDRSFRISPALFPEGKCRIGDVNFDIAESRSKVFISSMKEAAPIVIDHKVDSLIFLHAYAGGRLSNGDLVGEYCVVYLDGVVESIPLVCGVNIERIRHSAIRNPRLHYLERGLGTPVDAGVNIYPDAGGDNVYVYSCEWTNRRPNAVVSSVVVRPTSKAAIFLLALSATKAMNRPAFSGDK